MINAKLNYITPFSNKNITINDFQCSKVKSKRNEFYIELYTECYEIRGIIKLNTNTSHLQNSNCIIDNKVIIDKNIKQIFDTLHYYRKDHLIQHNDTFFATFRDSYSHTLNWCIINNRVEFINNSGNSGLILASSRLKLNKEKLDIDSIIFGELSCEFLDTAAIIDNYIPYQTYFKAIIKPYVLPNKKIITDSTCSQQQISSFHGNCVEKLAFLENDSLFLYFKFSWDDGCHSLSLGLSIYKDKIDKIKMQKAYDTGPWPIFWTPRKFELILDKTNYKENEEIKGCINFLFYDDYYYFHEVGINGSFKLDINGMRENILNGSKSPISKRSYIKFINGKK